MVPAGLLLQPDNEFQTFYEKELLPPGHCHYLPHESFFPCRAGSYPSFRDLCICYQRDNSIARQLGQ